MFLSRITSALCVASLFMGEVAYAAPSNDKEMDDHANLISLVEAMGIKVVFDGHNCDGKYYGYYMYDGSELALCSNKRGTKAENLDTIRHEVWHVYQDLKDCSLKDKGAVSAVFTPGVVPHMFTASAAKNYTQEQISSEAEATWAANTFSAEQINILLYSKAKSCGYKF